MRKIKDLAAHQTPVVLIVLLALIGTSGFIATGEAIQVTLTEMFIRVIVVVGLYVFIGNSGIISFGQIGFMCIGAYATGWATAEPMFKQVMLSGLPTFLQEGQYPFAAGVAAAVVLPAAVALCVGIAIMRLSGTAASIATFAFLIIVNSVYSNWDSVTAGVSSIIGIPTVVGPWTAFAFASVAIIVAWLFQISRFGLMLRASRDDEVAARASAVRVERTRLIAFVLSAALVGMAGGLYAQFLGILSVEPFYLSLTFTTLAMLVVGGMFSLTGAVSGVVAVTAIVEVLRFFEKGVTVGDTTLSLPSGTQEIGLGVLLAAILIFRPNGLSGGRELAPLSCPETAESPQSVSPITRLPDEVTGAAAGDH